MIEPVKVNDVLNYGFDDHFEIVQKYETIDALWGIDHAKITDEDIKALKEGKYLYQNNGEYAQIISYEKSESEE